MKKPSHRSNRATTSNTACTHEALSAHVNKWKRFRGRMRWCCPARRTTKVNSIACNCCGLQLLLCSPSLHPAAPSHCARHAARAHQRAKQTKMCTHLHMRLFTPCIAHRKKNHTPLLPVQGRHGKAHNLHHAAHVTLQLPLAATTVWAKGEGAQQAHKAKQLPRTGSRHSWRAAGATGAGCAGLRCKPQALRAIGRSVWVQMTMVRWGQARRRLCE